MAQEQNISFLTRDINPIDISFHDLKFSAATNKKGTKTIIKNMSGRFKAGELSAIMGPSGAGKSTLLNILAGYRCVEESGRICVNGFPRDTRQFSKLCRYIMQDHDLQGWLTVEECMLLAADFKLGSTVSKAEKSNAVQDILRQLNLLKHKDVFSDRLSGGQKKRLSIALDLINNPAVIFLDEPTTGLDEVASLQCISLLKQLAEGGRTVICSIHTPSAKLLQMFDHLYIVASGMCVYQGNPTGLVSFLQTLDLNCPKNYNPADFFIDVASGEYGNFVSNLVSLTQNGKISFSSYDEKLELYSNNAPYITHNDTLDNLSSFKCSTWMQCKTHIKRIALQTSRDTHGLIISASVKLYLSLSITLVYYKTGMDASKIFPSFSFFLATIMIYSYMFLITPILKYPVELKVIKREYFNKWYNLQSLVLAKLITSIPGLMLFNLSYLLITYIPAEQPIEPQRIIMFFTMCSMVAMVADAMGSAIAAHMNIPNGVFVGCVLFVPFFVLSGFGSGLGDQAIPPVVHWMMRGSYTRYAVEGFAVALYGGDRDKIPCPDDALICHLTYPKDIIRFHNLEKSNFWVSFIALIFLFILTKAIGLWLLKQRLTPGKIWSTGRQYLTNMI